MEVTIYTTRFCPYCINARALLESKGVEYQEIAIDGNPVLRQEMTQRAGSYTVPQIWIGEEHIGGCDDLYALERNDSLDRLLENMHARVEL